MIFFKVFAENSGTKQMTAVITKKKEIRNETNKVNWATGKIRHFNNVQTVSLVKWTLKRTVTEITKVHENQHTVTDRVDNPLTQMQVDSTHCSTEQTNRRATNKDTT